MQIIPSYAETVQYVYDDLNRLKWAKHGDGTVIEYIYDEVGNRDQKTTYRVADVSVTPSSYDYGGVEIVSFLDKVFTVQNAGGVDLTINSVTSPSPPFSLILNNCSGRTLAFLETCTITARFAPDAETTYPGGFNISTNDPDENPVTVSFIGTGTAVPSDYYRDKDGDGAPNHSDNCIYRYNPTQADADHDGLGDACDSCQGVLPIKVGSSYYSSLQDAYDSATPGAVIYVQAETLYQSLVADKSRPVTLDAGYDCSFSSYAAMTILKGEITNSDGLLILKTVSVRKYDNSPVDCSSITDPNLEDYDNDGVKDACDACPDDTDPVCDKDTDGDGMPDSFEIQYDLNRSDPLDANLDADGDGITNLNEYLYGTDPLIRNTDTDGDGIPDTVDNCDTSMPVRIGGTGYSTLQGAYSAAADGAVIQSQYEILTGDLNLNLNKSVTLESGYDCSYTTYTGTTRIKGDMNITNGKVTLNSGTMIVE